MSFISMEFMCLRKSQKREELAPYVTPLIELILQEALDFTFL